MACGYLFYKVYYVKTLFDWGVRVRRVCEQTTHTEKK
jgi:hypothetical protein